MAAHPWAESIELGTSSIVLYSEFVAVTQFYEYISL